MAGVPESTGLFGPSIQLLLAPDWDRMGMTAAMTQVYTILQGAKLVNQQAPLPVNNPGTDTPAFQVSLPQDSPLAFRLNIQRDGGNITEEIPWDNLRNPRGSGGASVRQVKITAIKQDTLTVTDPRDGSFDGVAVAKPTQLQASLPLPSGVQSITYDPSGALTRTLTVSSTQMEDQVLLPPYTVGDTLFVIQATSTITTDGSSELSDGQGVEWLDLNVDAREWATQIPLDEVTRSP